MLQFRKRSTMSNPKITPQAGEKEHIFKSRRSQVDIPDMTLPEFILHDVDEHCNEVAIVEALTGKKYTYGEVKRETERFAKGLKSIGLQKGNSVLVVLPNMAESAIVSLGIMAAGGVFSGVNPQFHPYEIKKQMDISEAKFIITIPITYQKVKDFRLPTIIISEEPIENCMLYSDILQLSNDYGSSDTGDSVTQDDICALPFSSGTTGPPKGVMVTHRNLVAGLCTTLFSITPERRGNFVTLGIMPFFHIYGLSGTCYATLKGKGKVVVIERFEIKSFMKALIDYEVHYAPVVPPILTAMAKNPDVDEFDLGKLKLKAVLTAAAPLPLDIRLTFEAKFPNVQIQEAYGMTEHSCITLADENPFKDAKTGEKKKSVGFILPNVEVKFVDPSTGISVGVNTPGEICLRSPAVMKGYFKNEKETAKAIDSKGWLHTGDIGYIDEDGDVFLVDRIKEMIKYKGFQVSPTELEDILHSHPSISDVAVLGLPDDEAGEVPAACVVLKPHARDREEEIMEFVASRVASYKRVRMVQFVETIPKSAAGKIMKKELKISMLTKIKSKI